MRKFDLGQTITILANVGVLVGLLLVAIQINQNTRIAEAQLANDYFLADMQLELSMMGDDPIASFAKAVYTPRRRLSVTQPSWTGISTMDSCRSRG